MLFCNKCKKYYQDNSKFCFICGSPLVVTQDPNTKPQENKIPVQNITKSEPAALSKSEKSKKSKKGLLAIVGMFLINFIPLLGFPLSFIWAWTKFKSSKLKLISLTSSFIILNIAVTVFGYAAAVNLMKNSLAKAAEKQGALKTIYRMDSQAAAGSTEYTVNSPGTYDIPAADTSSIKDIIPKDDEIINSDLPNSLIPGFSNLSPEENFPESFEAGEYQLPENISMPEYDDEGNMLIDTDNDGVSDISVHEDGTFYSEDINTPNQEGINNTLPKEDEHGNMYMDLDNDGIAETIYCPDGVILPVKGSRIDEDGKRYVDENGDGNYEIFYDTDGSTYMDYDDNGTYDVLMKDGNIYYDLDGDGAYDQTFENEYGQG
ncbi:MAG: zinc ribbon domain-containing protein [Firmicutes bacterium]|nr:zinc ribbon domain-containing protein [Bacillota bacterium]